MKIKDLMKTLVFSLHPDMKWKEAAETLLGRGISGAPVVDDEGKLIGILSEKDLFRGIYPSYEDFYKTPGAHLDFEKLEAEAQQVKNKTVAEVMNKRLISAHPEDPILKIGGLMVASGIHRVPVVDSEDKLVGMVSRRDIYRAILKNYFNI